MHAARKTFVPRLAAWRLLLCLAAMTLSGAGIRAQDAPPANPLRQFFRNFDRNIREGAEALEQARKQRDQIDLRPNQQAEVANQLEKGRELIRRERWHDAVDVLQYLIELPADTFVMEPDHAFLSLKNQAEQLLSELPDEGRRTYLNRYAAAADELERRVEEYRDEMLLRELVDHYRATPAGQRGVLRLSRLLADQGHRHDAAGLLIRSAQLTRDRVARAEFGRMAIDLLSRASDAEAARQLGRNLGWTPQEVEIVVSSAPAQRAASPQVRRGPYLTADTVSLPGDDPDLVLFPVWSQPLIERDSVRESVLRLEESLKAEGRTPLPTSLPLAVEDRLVFRTLQSLQVRRASDGSLLHEMRMARSPEECFSTSERRGMDIRESDPLCSQLYRDGVFGSVSSDGRQLFAIEEQGTLEVREQDRWGRNDSSSGLTGPWAHNELVAYDLESGRVRWRVGGPMIEEEFSRPLAGTYFFGAPLPRGNELYVIGERAGEVMLFCLSRDSGEPLWSQSLTTAGRSVGEDVVRRQWECRPAFVDGLVLCPTTTGWLIAVDPAMRRLRWGARFAPRLATFGQFRSGYSVNGIQELNQRWQDMILHAAGSRVYVSPLEMPDELSMAEPVLICLDAHDGREIWKIPKGEFLYVAGCHDRGVLVVGRSKVALLGRDDGKAVWTYGLSDPPVGRGIFMDGRFLLPMSDRLVLLDSHTGKEVRVAGLPAGMTPLRNLAFAGEFLVSLSPDAIQAFPMPTSARTNETSPIVAAAKELQSIQDLDITQSSAEILRRLTALQARSGELPVAFQDQVREFEWHLLVSLYRSDSISSEELVARLRRLAKTPERIRELELLEVDLLLANKDWKETTDRLCTLLCRVSSGETSLHLSERSWNRSVWLGDCFARVWERMAENERREFGPWLLARLSDRVERSPSDPELSTALWFHPIGQAAELRLAELAISTGNRAEALIRWLRVSHANDRENRQAALRRMAEEFGRAGWVSTADVCRRQLAEGISPSPPVELPDSKTSEELRGKSPGSISTDATDEIPVDTPWGVTRLGPSDDDRVLSRIRILNADLPDWELWDVQYHRSTTRLEFRRSRPQPLNWTVPLGRLNELEHHMLPGARSVGPVAFVMHAGVLHALSVIDRQVVWTWVPDLPPSLLSRLPAPFQRSTTRMQTPASLMSSGRLAGNDRPAGYLLVAHERALVVRCQDLMALDPVSGEELWRDRGVPGDANVELLGDSLLIIVPGKPIEVRSIPSGRKLPLHPLSGTILNVLGRSGDGLVTLEAAADRMSYRLRVIDRDGNEQAGETLPDSCLMTKIDENAYCWLTRQGELFSFDGRVRKTVYHGRLDSELTKAYRHVYAPADRERIFILMDRGESHLSHINIPSIRFSGVIATFSRRGALLWKAELNAMDPPAETQDAGTEERWSRNLLVDEFEENPLLLFAGDRPDRFQDLYFHRLQLTGFDKRTGKQVLDWRRSSDSGGFSDLHFDRAFNQLNLRTYNDRLLLRPVPSSVSGPGVHR